MNAMTTPDLIEVEPLDLSDLLATGEALLVDVREANEVEMEHIPGALFMPMSFFDAEHFPRIPGKKVIFMCAVGKRSEAAGKQLIKAGHPQAIHLRGGLKAWKEAGLSTEH